MKKGFTLIELLAVIVVIVVIALIAVPVLLNVIEKARKGAAEASTYSYLEAFSNYVAQSEVDNTLRKIEANNRYNLNKQTTINETLYQGINEYVKIKGYIPTGVDDYIVINDKYQVVEGELSVNSYLATIENGKIVSIVKGEKIAVESLSIEGINETGLTMERGMTYQVTPLFSPTNSSDKRVEYKSDDTSIATVSELGVVKGVKTGTVTITATSLSDRSKKAEFELEIIAPTIVTSVDISVAKSNIVIGEEIQITKVLEPSDTTTTLITYTSQPSGIVEIDSFGKILGVSAGTTTITGTTANGLTDTLEITVSSVLAESVSISSTNSTIYLGSTTQVTSTILPSNTTNKTITYTSSNTGVATVTSTGLVTSVSPGNTTITATTSNGKTASLNIKVSTKVNAPVLSSGMTPVKWDSNNNEITTTSTDPNWYDYDNQKWANVKTNDGSYFVWIPRYAYKITSGYHSTTTGSISVKFLVGTTNVSGDNITALTSGYNVSGTNTSNAYFVHPSFNFDGEIKGYWVAKYEATAAEGGINNNYTPYVACSTNNVTTKTIKIIPNATSWRCISTSTAYNLSLNMKNKTVYGWSSSQVDTHMIKNTEWGAVVYLSKSIYGANTNEVYINNNQNYITGCAGNTVVEASSTTCQNAYNTSIGVRASTTYNITGIYDMSGGAWERVMGNYNNLGFENLAATIPSKYITRYTTATANLLNSVGMNYDTAIYGDGVYETSGTAARYNGTAWVGSLSASWNIDSSGLPYNVSSFFIRGGSNDSIYGSGIFSFGTNGGGGGISTHTFRPIVYVVS